MSNQADIQRLAAQMAAEKDPEKLAAIKQRLIEKVNAEKAIRKAAEEKAATGPTYPVGFAVTYDGKTATIVGTNKDARGNWSYSVKVEAGMPLGIGDGVYQLSEPDLRQEMINRFNAQLAPGQIYAQGMFITGPNRVSGLITNVSKNAAGEFVYVLKNWGTSVAQKELQGMLLRA